MLPVISSNVPKIIGRVHGNVVESLLVHLANASYNFSRGAMLKDS
jgi:hypothetical protein